MLDLLSFFKMPPRVLEPESMEGREEAMAYDCLVRKYLGILHEGFVQTLLNISPKKGLALEVGTGTGRISLLFSRYAREYRIIAIDLSASMLEVAINNAEKECNTRVKFMRSDATKLPFKDKSFDLVFSHNMLHHLPDPFPALREMKRVLKNDGAFIVRDLKRLPHFLRWLHVHIFGICYDPIMKRQYNDSIKAAFDDLEWQDFIDLLDLKGIKLTKQFLTHISIVRPAIVRGHSLKIPYTFKTIPRIFYEEK